MRLQIFIIIITMHSISEMVCFRVRVIDQRRPWLSKQGPPAKNKQQQRGKIIRCCGKKRCMGDYNSPKAKENGTISLLAVAETKELSHQESTPTGKEVSSTLESLNVPTLEASTDSKIDITEASAPTASDTVTPTSAPPENQVSTSQTEDASMTSTDLTAGSTDSPTESTTTAITSSTTISTSTTTTTTICPSTTPVYCKNHKEAQLLSSSIVLSPTSEKVISQNGSVYLVGSNSTNITHAAAVCLRKGMTLPNLINLDTFNAVSRISQELSMGEIWTSGFITKSTGACDPNISIFWCLSSTNGDTWWKSNMAGLDNSSIGSHISVKNNSLKIINDTTDLRFMCTCPRTNTCPKNCAKDPLLFSADGTFNEKGRRGNWRSFCGTTYVFTSDIGTWEQNYARCCSLGMRPVWFKDPAEMACLAREVAASNWTLSLNFWTAGTHYSCWGQWGWCGPTGQEAASTDGLKWASMQPDNAKGTENCLHMQVLKNNTGLVLSDRICSAKYFMACQGNLSFVKPCDGPSCPRECVKNSTLFLADGALRDRHKYGNWIQGCGRDFVFSKSNMTWDDAHRFCCSINARLLNVERLDFLDCLTTTTDKVPKAKYSWALGKEFWTSGTNKNCSQILSWCSVLAQPLNSREARWKTGHPKQGDNHCITVSLNDRSTTENSSLATFPCTELKQFICERPRSKLDSLQRSLECSETWNLTDDEIRVIQSPTFNASIASKKLKCYIKCVGLGYNLFDFESSQFSPQMATLMESAAGDNDQVLQAGLAGLEDCSKRAEDDCSTAAAFYGCNNEKNPTLMATMISSTNKSSPSTADPNAGTVTSQCVDTHWRTCPPKPNCTVDVSANSNNRFIFKFHLIQSARRNALFAQGSDAIGNVLTTATLRKYYVGQRLQMHPQAAMYCCELGMRLAVFETEEMIADLRATGVNFGIHYAYIAATYDNGDNTDSWCDTYGPVPASIPVHPYTYGICNRVEPSVLDFKGNMVPFLGGMFGTAAFFICQ